MKYDDFLLYNPYKKGTPEYEYWLFGWNEALWEIKSETIDYLQPNEY